MLIISTVTFLLPVGTGKGHPAQEFSFLQVVIGVWIVASIAEEVFTRGLLQSFLAPLKGSGIRFPKVFLSVPVIFSATFFSLMHVPLLLMGMDSALGVSILISTWLVGLVAGYYREQSGSLLPAVTAHMLANIFGFAYGVLAQCFKGG